MAGIFKSGRSTAKSVVDQAMQKGKSAPKAKKPVLLNVKRGGGGDREGPGLKNPGTPIGGSKALDLSNLDRA